MYKSLINFRGFFNTIFLENREECKAVSRMYISKFSLDPPPMPDIGVKWYGIGGIFKSPFIIGVGEAGKEAVLPEAV